MTPWSTIFRPAALAVVLFLSTAGVLARLPAETGEALALRWLRAAADHPVRTPAALTCLLLALRRRRPGEPVEELDPKGAGRPAMRYHGVPFRPVPGKLSPREPTARASAPEIHDDRHPA